jgi:hypothetical protein
MEESANITPNESKKSNKWVKRTIICLILLVAGYGSYKFASFYVAPGRAVQQVYLIPKDAIFIIRTNQAIDNWKKFSSSEPWMCLKQSPSMENIAQKAGTLDSILQANQKLLSLVGKRDLMISAHKVRTGFWDFLFVFDLQKISEMDMLKEQIDKIYSLMDFKVTYRKFEDTDIIELRDSETRQILYTAFVDNHYVASYTSKLVETSIRERKNPNIGLDPFYIEADQKLSGKGLCQLFVQYAYLPDLLEMYAGQNKGLNSIFSQSLAYAGLNFYASSDKLELSGFTLLKDTIDPYTAAFLRSGKSEIKAGSVLPDRTAFFTHIGFDNPATFVKELEKAIASESNDLYSSYKKSYDKIESLFDISLQDDFLSWMSGEFAVSELEPGLLDFEPEMILAIRAKDVDFAKEKMKFIEKKVKRRTPITIKTVTYKNYAINYLELKGFFALFFGKMFDKFEKPYYTYIDDYVVFSNKPASLLSLIEDYTEGRVLSKEKGFKQILSQTGKKSSYFAYLNTVKFFPLLKPIMNAKSWNNLSAYKSIAFAFPYSGLQIIGDQHEVFTQLVFNYKPFVEEKDDNEDIDNEDDINSGLNEIDELHLFYAEKFQGKVYRAFYPEGALKSECEIKDGKRHGKYREYDENGNLIARGKYKKGNPKGTWKYYSVDGELINKVKF